MQTDDIQEFNLDRKLRDSLVADAFSGNIVKWRGPRDARFLILTDHPLTEDAVAGIIDSSSELRLRFNSIFNAAFSHADRPRNRYAIASCCVGWSTDEKKHNLTPLELKASSSHVVDLLLAMPKLEMILAVGLYATELCYRNFDVNLMYGRPSDVDLQVTDEVSSTMRVRKRLDKVESTIVAGTRVLRYLQVASKDTTTNNAFVTGTIININKLVKASPILKDLDVRTDERLNFEDSSRYLTYESFQDRFHKMLRDERAMKLDKLERGVYDIEDEGGTDSVFVDASLDPYVRNGVPPVNDEYFLMNYRLEYDSVLNCMRMHAATPSGTPVFVTFTDVIFTFWIRPNLAFAAPGFPEDWCNIFNGTRLQEHHLDYLRGKLKSSLWHSIKERGGGNSDASKSFRLSVETSKHDYKDGYFNDGKDGKLNERVFDFIKCEVSNYSFIKVIVNTLNSIHKKYVEARSLAKEPSRGASLLACMDLRHDIYEIFSPETMFGKRYDILMSHWHRAYNLNLTLPRAVAPELGVHHVTHLEANIRIAPDGNPLECLNPLERVSLGYNGLTSFDMPKALQTGFDIESGKFGKYFGGTTYWDSPILCMCLVSRRADDRVDTYKTPSFEATKGYRYFGFMLGLVDEAMEGSELNGPVECYQFAKEKEMLQAYLYFYSIMHPRYYITHNGKRYDMPRVLNRSRVLGIDVKSLGYVRSQTTRITERQFNSRAHSEKTITSLDNECGITQIDTCEIFMRERKDKSNTLDFLSRLLLGTTKSDMPYEAIMGYFKESDKSRWTLAHYCFRDAQLPMQLVAHSKLIVAMNRLACASGFVSEDLISEKGMQEKVIGGYFKGNKELGSRYILRTNGFFTKSYNENILLTARQLTEKYEADSQFFEDRKNAKNGNDKNFKVASVQLGKRDAAQAAASTPSGNKRQRTRTTPAKNLRGSNVNPTSIVSYFRSVTSQESVVHDDVDGGVVDKEKITLSHWEKLTRTKYSHSKIAEDDEPDDDGGDLLADVQRSAHAESNKGKIKERPAEPPPTEWKSYPGWSGETLTSSSSSSSSARNAEDQEISDIVRRQNVERDMAIAKASCNDMANRTAEYQGAVVMKERLGWYHDLPALCIDFASLYPSIMMMYNMGSNTKVYEDDMEERGVTEDMVIAPSKQKVVNPRTGREVRLFFLCKEIRRGVLAVTEFMLLRLRNEAKELIEFYGNEFLEDGVTPNPNYNKVLAAVATAASNNIKLLMNSMYGVCGTRGVLGDTHVAGAVTGCGRESIMLAKNKTIRRYNAICVGGDTDSVFMQFPGLARGQFEAKWERARKRLEELGVDHPKCQRAKFPALPDGWWRLKDMEAITAFAQEEWVPRINKNFKWPMKVDFEKAMFRFVAFAAKRYSFFYAFIGKTPYLTSKGLETVRRDALPFTQKVLTELFKIIQVMPAKSPFTFEEDPDGSKADAIDLAFVKELKQKAVDYIREKAGELARGEVSIVDLILSKQRSREYYTNQNQEHLTVVRRLEERGLEAPPVGSRVPFVYTHINDARKGQARKGYEIADDPECVVKEGIPIDYMYYLDHKFKKSIVRTMRHFLYDEMVERVSKRKLSDYRSGGGTSSRPAKRAKIELDENGNIPVSMDEVDTETEQYLFGTAQTGSVNARNIQTRYLELTRGRVRSAHVDKNNRSLISSYTQRDETLLESLKKKYGTEDFREVLARESEVVDNAAEAYGACLKTCRSCLKIDDSKPVLCSANGCPQYLPRLLSQGAFVRSEKLLDELCMDIESLFK